MSPFRLLHALGLVCITAHIAIAEQVERDGALYHLYRVDKARYADLHLLWRGKDGQPLRDFIGLQKHLAADGKSIAFAMNAGIYAQGPTPCGLTVSGGKELVPLNLKDAEGNFYLKPNGVFYLDDKLGAGVMESTEFSRSGIKPRIATQSGPLLLQRGVVHPKFNANSPNKRLRNSVGVRASDGQIIFVMSDRNDRAKGTVTFYQLAQLFLHLGCKDALFLDGDLSDMLVDPAPDAKLTPNTFAALFVVAK
jgi:uncharacterized protein YigE (DUF2233 family)